MKIAVASGKGGTGKTLVSTNLFRAAQQMELYASIVDCDAEEPNVSEFIKGDFLNKINVTQKIPVIDSEKCTFCAKCYDYCNYHAIICLPPAHFIQVIEELCHDCGACMAACEFGAVSEKEKLLGEVTTKINKHSKIIEGCTQVGIYSPVPVIKKAIAQADKKFLSIFDSPPGISCPFITTVSNSDYVILVTEPTPFGLNDLKLSVETLQQTVKPFGVIVNKAGLGNSEVYHFLKLNNIPLLMEIPFDKEIARLYSTGRIISEEMPGYLELFSDLLKAILKN